MLEKFEDIIEIGLCEHCEGRPKCPVNDNEVRAMQEAIMEELDIGTDSYDYLYTKIMALIIKFMHRSTCI